MPYYFMTLILLVVSIILGVITLAVNGKGKVAFGVGTVAAVISAAISFTAMSIPKPEIYTTNGNSVKENEVYFSTEWPLTVKYTCSLLNKDIAISNPYYVENTAESYYCQTIELLEEINNRGIKSFFDVDFEI